MSNALVLPLGQTRPSWKSIDGSRRAVEGFFYRWTLPVGYRKHLATRVSFSLGLVVEVAVVLRRQG